MPKLTLEMKQKIFSIGARLNSEGSLESLLFEVQNEMCRLMDAQVASVFLYDDEEDCMVFLSLTGEVRDLIRSIKVPMTSIAGTAFLEGNGLIVNDVTAFPGHFKQTDDQSGFHTHNILACPLETDRRIGVIEILNRMNQVFTQDDLEILRLFSRMISFKIATEYHKQQMHQQMKSIIESIAQAIDLRDQYTHQHSRNVANLSVQIARRMGMTESQTKEVEIAALLHDIGKIGIQDAILLKPGRLTLEEFQLIQRHPLIGMEMLQHASMISQQILHSIGQHHEKLNGSGYPKGLKGQEILVSSRIIAVVDIYDALVNKRVYKRGASQKEVFEIMDPMVPNELDPEIYGVLKEIVSIESSEHIENACE